MYNVQVKETVLDEYKDLWGKFNKEFQETRCMIEDKTKQLTQSEEEKKR